MGFLYIRYFDIHLGNNEGFSFSNQLVILLNI